MKKSKTRLFVEKKISQNLMIYIKDKQHHFLKNVLRVKLNDKITLFDGTTGEWESNVISISKEKTAVKILKKIREFEYQPDIWLIFAPIKIGANTIKKTSNFKKVAKVAKNSKSSKK